jgi:hypothetical protein
MLLVFVVYCNVMLIIIVVSLQASMYNACLNSPSALKMSYRAGYLDAPSSCELNTDDIENSNCVFSCPTPEKAVAAANSMVTMLGDFFSDSVNSSVIETYLESFICGGGLSKIYVGDHLEAASPSDPSFWVIHPTLERLTHAKLMSGGFVNETWASNAESDFVCALSECYDDATDTTGYFPTCCYGHYEDDRMYNAFTGSREDYIGVTNAEMVNATDPRSTSYSMNYIYDKFTWPHCENEFNIDTLLVNLSTSDSTASYYSVREQTRIASKKMHAAQVKLSIEKFEQAKTAAKNSASTDTTSKATLV